MFEIAASRSGKGAHHRRTGSPILNVGSAFWRGSADRRQQPLKAHLVLAATELTNSVSKAEKLSRRLPRKFQPWQLLPADGTRPPFGLPPQCTLPGAGGCGRRGPAVEPAGKRVAPDAGDARREPMDDAHRGL